ncbi:hypothetical protein F4695_003989 [Rhizobium soli]|uniref:Uncharacterized protein n=1 Tax=Rhizobium soli TaxID=424798 RepID=A0A7X0JN25_9HYPH|nr:hypothetical protein [Rhizobium soli]MBB6510598.1 hypothetical protein [Rhizobium soli]
MDGSFLTGCDGTHRGHLGRNIGLVLPRTLLLASCISLAAGVSTVEADQSSSLGQTIAVGGPHVRADQVVEDSRCQIEHCVWEGQFILRATVSGGNWIKQVDLTLGKPVPVADGMLTLTTVTPDVSSRRRGDDVVPYRFTFLFQGGL